MLTWHCDLVQIQPVFTKSGQRYFRRSVMLGRSEIRHWNIKARTGSTHYSRSHSLPIRTTV